MFSGFSYFIYFPGTSHSKNSIYDRFTRAGKYPIRTHSFCNFFDFGFLLGKKRDKNRLEGKKIEEFDFYSFDLDEEKRLYFDLKDFRLGIYYFLKNRDYIAARQLILHGEQNELGHKPGRDDLKQYLKLYRKYDGDSIFNDNAAFLENYKRIVRLSGGSFPDLGIEILLHDLSNPPKSLCIIKNNISGRRLESGAINLVIDLKTRKLIYVDKLNAGARKFKCTTIPIFRKNYGLVGVICINVDINYLKEKVLSDIKYVEEFF